MDKKNSTSYQILIPAVLVPLGFFAVLAGRFDYYFDLNDDFMMQHILSGEYTGMPESRNIQSLYPLSLLFSVLYKLADQVEWYGIFLLLCQFGALSLVLRQILKLRKSAAHRGLLAGVAVLMYSGVMLYHLVFVQYSVTVGLIAAAAAVLLLTGRWSFKGTILPSALLIWLGYLLRSEMMLFLMPFLLLALALRLWTGSVWSGERITKALRRFLGISAVLAAGIVLLRAVDAWGYRSPEWREFRELFDARTQLYDFQKIPPYETNESFYDSIGLTGEEAALLQNYNFGLDQKIDAGTLRLTAEHAAELAAEQSLASRIRNALWDYRAELTDRADLPWNLVSILFYAAAVLCTAVRAVYAAEKRDRAEKGVLLLGILMLAAGRSLLWCYLFFYHRPVVRLTHPMCLMECVLLAWIIYSPGGAEPADQARSSSADMLKAGKTAYAAVCGLLIAGLLYASFMQVRMTVSEYERREAVNRPYQEYLAYCSDAKRQDGFYITDVYSTVDFSEKIFNNNEVKVLNWDLCGGWVCKSPLQEKKWAAYSADSAQEALLDPERHVYFVAKQEYDTGWLEDYYRSFGDRIRIERVDTAAGIFAVYQLRRE
ncbi:MAG: hypothetical protein IJV14_17845 [Lachnospiraceae bacterium]|nr:hypothetical protein [Lachnospiraceae bacterium]